MSQANAAEIDRWNNAVGKTWVRHQVELDRQIGPIGAEVECAFLASLGRGRGRRVLDIGCGAGETTIRLAAALTPDDEVVGVDVSAPMLELARSRAVTPGHAGVSFVQADAQTEPFPPESAAGVHSRFGVMFFDDPEAAFTNLRDACLEGSPLAFCCWRQLVENPWFTVPLEAASFVPRPPAGDPFAPGPFAFADPERVRRVLEAAGWSEVELKPIDLEIGGADLDTSALLMTRIGPLGNALRLAEADKALIARAEASVREALAANVRDAKVFLASASWLVTARS
jgi:SAM-dependent methyltransferase